MLIRISCLLCIFLAGHRPVHSQNQISGHIKEAKNGMAIRGVTVFMPDLNAGVASDSTGMYFFKNIPGGTYLIEISAIGFETIIEKITVKGTIEKDYSLKVFAYRLDDIIVTGVPSASDKQANPVSVVVMNKKDILQNSSTNVIDAIAKLPGISAITNGQSISKPVIRGLGYNRVLTIVDGVEQVDQAWFDEFGIEADPNAVSRYEILKGPASLAYGSDAIAGVVNLIAEPALPEGQVKGDVLLNYQTNNGLMNGLVHVAGTNKGISWSARIDNTMAHAYQNRYDGYVVNSQFSNFNTDATIGIHRKWGYSQIHAGYFNMATGIVDGSRDSATGLMVRPVAYPDLNGGAPGYELPTNQEQKSYTPFVINQRIRHTKLVWDNTIAAGAGRIKAIFSWQKNQRQETNDPTIPNTPNIYYSSDAATYDVRYIAPEINGFNISTGVNGVYQSSKSLGTLLLIPDYNFFELGAFAIASKKVGHLNISGGIRFDTRSFTGKDHWVDSTTQAPVDANATDAFHEFTAFTSHFSGLSYSIGGTCNFTKSIYAKINVAGGWRAPNVAECAANGVHDGTVVYEIGDNTLKPETSIEGDLTFGINSKDISAELNIFDNSITKFIYAEGLVSVFGGDSINNSLNAAGLGAAPVYKYAQRRANLYGGELSLNIHPSELPWIELNTGFSIVYGSLSDAPDSVKYLPFVPPAKITADLKFNIAAKAKSFKNSYVKIGLLNCSQQSRIYSQYAIYNGLNTALTPYEYNASNAATKSYTLLNAGAGTDVLSKGRTICSLYIYCTNLFNTGYIDYMSRFKYYPVNYTTGRVGVFNMGRNISFKLLIPLNFNG
jgi:iron complex outermembrane receptor protein